MLAIVLVCQALITASVSSNTMFEPVDELKGFIADGAGVIYLGDSSLLRSHSSDSTDASIAAMLDDLLPDTQVSLIAHEAYGMEIFQAYAEYIAAHEPHPKYVIVPINLRSFATVWDQNPAWQFEKEKILLRNDSFWFRMVAKPLFVFKACKLTPISQKAYRDLPVYDGEEQTGVIKDYANPSFLTYSDENLKKKLVVRYMYALRPAHRKLNAMAELGRTLQEANVTPLFYISPIDCETGADVLGQRFTERIAANARVIRDLLDENDLPYIDLSCSVALDGFMWQDDIKDLYPNEHLNEKGRRYVAGELSALLQRLDRRMETADDR